MTERLSESLKQFIAAQINSVEHLEILLLLSENPRRFWTVRSLFKVIQSNEASIATRLQTMKQQGFVKEGPGKTFQFSPASKEIAQNIAALVEAYKASRVRVIEAIFCEPGDPAQN